MCKCEALQIPSRTTSCLQNTLEISVGVISMGWNSDLCYVIVNTLVHAIICYAVPVLFWDRTVFPSSEYRQLSNIRRTQSQNMMFSSRLAVVFAQSIEAMC